MRVPAIAADDYGMRESAAMTLRRPVPWSRWPRSLGIVVIALVALASVGHFWHHLTDDCENPREAFPHACAQCAGFHGGVIAESTQASVTPRLVDLAEVLVIADLDRVEQLRATGSPRAPPLS
jgi:hypothetical protein